MFSKLLISIAITFVFFVGCTQSVNAFEFSKAPSYIIIPSLKIALPVTTSKIIYDTWDVSQTTVNFGESSAIPGNRGNTVIFAHALPNLFLSLPLIQNGQEIHLFTDTDWFIYKVDATMVVDPEDVSVLSPTKNHELTIYTCIGINYEKRFVAKAHLIPTHLIPQ